MVLNAKHVSLAGMAVAIMLALGLCTTVAGARMPIILPPPGPPGPGWVWVPPVYETVYEQEWVEARVERVAQQVWVPAQYGYQPLYDAWGNIVRYEYVLICAGHYETRWHETVIPAHWDTVAKQVLVRAGYWQRVDIRPLPPPMPPMPPILDRPIGVPSVGVEGYQKPRGDEGSGPFTPLTEWPTK